MAENNNSAHHVQCRISLRIIHIVFCMLLLLSGPMLAAGTLSGQIFDAADGTTPVHPVEISLWDPETGEFAGFEIINGSNGFWEISNVPVGEYKLLFLAQREAEHYLDELYGGVRCDNLGCDKSALGTPLNVVDGTISIDYQLTRGLLISGTVTDQFGTPMERVYIDLFDENGNYVCCQNETDSNGFWDHPVAGSGIYYAQVAPWSVSVHQPQVWNNRACDNCNVASTGDPVVVDQDDVMDINFSLSLIEKISPSDAVLNDDFSESGLNSCRWLPNNKAAEQRIEFDDELRITSPQGLPSTTAVVGQNGISGDFSASVRVTPGTGWQQLTTGAHVPGMAMAANAIDEIGIDVVKITGADVLLEAYSTASQNVYQTIGSLNISDFSDGYLRLNRSGSTWKAEYKTDGDWQLIGSLNRELGMVYPRLRINHSDSSEPLVVAFDNFEVEGGTIRASNQHTRLSRFLPRTDLMIGGVFETTRIERVYDQTWVNPSPQQVLANAGMNWARVGLTNYFAPELDGLGITEWPNWQGDGLYYAANEARIQMLQEARDAGMNLIAFFYLSGAYGEWVGNIGQQNSPQGWEDLDLVETAVEVENLSAQLAQKMIANGLDIKIYEIGNETDWGFAGFYPGLKINYPDWSDQSEDLATIRSYIFHPQSVLFKAAIKGVRSVHPDAKFALHPTGLLDTSSNSFAKAYFKYMKEQGVEYDYAALSWPYPYPDATGEWFLNRWSVPCAFYSMEELSAYLAAMGKPSYFAEGSYPSSPADFSVPPMEGMPFSEEGQEKFLSTMLNFVSNNLNMLGFFYFYPEYWDRPGEPGPADVELQSYGLFNTDSEEGARRSLGSLNVNLQTPPTVTSQFSGLWKDPLQPGEAWTLEILTTESGDQPGTARVSWCSDQSDGGARQLVQGIGPIKGNRISLLGLKTPDGVVFKSGFEAKVGSDSDLMVEMAFRDGSEAIFTWNGGADWDSGRFEIERQGPVTGELTCN